MGIFSLLRRGEKLRYLVPESVYVTEIRMAKGLKYREQCAAVQEHLKKIGYSHYRHSFHILPDNKCEVVCFEYSMRDLLVQNVDCVGVYSLARALVNKLADKGAKTVAVALERFGIVAIFNHGKLAEYVVVEQDKQAVELELRRLFKFRQVAGTADTLVISDGSLSTFEAIIVDLDKDHRFKYQRGDYVFRTRWYAGRRNRVYHELARNPSGTRNRASNANANANAVAAAQTAIWQDFMLIGVLLVLGLVNIMVAVKLVFMDEKVTELVGRIDALAEQQVVLEKSQRQDAEDRMGRLHTSLERKIASVLKEMNRSGKTLQESLAKLESSKPTIDAYVGPYSDAELNRVINAPAQAPESEMLTEPAEPEPDPVSITVLMRSGSSILCMVRQGRTSQTVRLADQLPVRLPDGSELLYQRATNRVVHKQGDVLTTLKLDYS